MNNKNWYKARGYLHLLPRLNTHEDLPWVQRYVNNPNRVRAHAFLPLLHKKIEQRRYKIIGYENGKVIRSHFEKNKNGSKKPTKKIRPIHYAAHLDAQIYAFYAVEKIQKLYEYRLKDFSTLSECISAYRRIPTGNGLSCKNNIHFAKDVFDHIKSKHQGCCAMAFDIESFFNGLDHKILKKAWCKLLNTQSLPPDHYNIYKSVTNYRYIMLDDLRLKPGDKKSPFNEARLAKLRSKGAFSFFECAVDLRNAIERGELPVYHNQTKKRKSGNIKHVVGIPQGLPISAILANLYLYEFDKLIYEKIVVQNGGFYRRYSDDIVVVCNVEQYNIIKEYVEETIRDFKLQIASKKTEICIFKPESKEGYSRLVPYSLNRASNLFQIGVPFRYLGFEFYGDYTLIKSSNLSKFYRRMKSAVKTRIKRTRHWQDEMLEEKPILYKKKLYRMFTLMGYRAKWVRVWKSDISFDPIFRRSIVNQRFAPKKYRGNVLTYALRAADILKEPKIRKQFRRCFKVLKDLIRNF